MKDEGSSPPLGGRNEDSSLFSLESLKRTEEQALKKQRDREDSGLIDLKALALIERDGSPKTSDVGVASIIAPGDLFAAPVVATPVTAAPISASPVALTAEEPPKPNRTPLYVGAGVLVAIAAGVAVFMTAQGDSTPAATAAAATAAVVAAAPSVTAAPTAATAATTSAAETTKAVTPGERAAPTASSASASAAAPVKPVIASGPRSGPAAPKAAAAPKDDPPAAAPAKPADACDLACQMQRAVNKK